jgi:hypothetical protein
MLPNPASCAIRVRSGLSLCVRACLSPKPCALCDPLQVLPATYNPADPASERQEVQIGALFLMMGRGLERLQVCGCICRFGLFG